MPRFSYPSPQAILAGLALLAGPAAAQGPAPTVVTPPAAAVPMAPGPVVPPTVPIAPGPVAPVVPAAVVDPKVTVLFNQAIAAHQALTALTATVSVTSAGTGADTTQTVTLAFQKPNAARIAVTNTAGPVVNFFSDGKTLTIYAVHDKKYRVDPVPPGANVIPVVLVQAHALVPRLIGQPEALSELLSQPGVTATLGAAGTIGGVPTDTVTAVLPAPDGSSVHLTFSFGTADHLLRQVIQTASIPKNGTPQPFTHTETVTSLVTTPILTASDFTFTPPPGVTKTAATPTAPPAGLTAPKAAQAAPAEPTMHDPRLVPGAKPFTLTAKDLSGKPLSLAQYKGKVVLMDFWATWCGPCVGEMPNVIAAYKKYHALGFDIVGISLDESRPALTAFIAKNQMPWRQVFDGKGWNSAVPHQYGVQAIPFGLLIGRDGHITAVDVRGPALTAAIKQALAKKVALAK